MANGRRASKAFTMANPHVPMPLERSFESDAPGPIRAEKVND
jgi:hypothetical protein